MTSPKAFRFRETLSISLISAISIIGAPIGIVEKTDIAPKDQFPMSSVDNTSDTDNVETKTFSMKTYFQNLVEYSALNSQGSCGYVSFIQYLSYYDTFLNDSIIPDAYERHGSFETRAEALSVSPGVLRQSYPKPASSGNTDFYDFVQANYRDDYQLNCMKIVNEDVFNRENDPYSWSCSIGMWNYQGLLNGLFGEGVVEFDYVDHLEDPDDYTTGEYRERIENETKALLDQGIPVILHIRQPSGTKLWGDGVSYHSVVAYYYDDEGIHANFGWGSSSADTIVNPSGSSSSENWYITNVGVCDFSAFSLSHSDNYEIGGLKYCGCGEHVYHTYSLCQGFIGLDGYYSTRRHKVICACGHSETRAHFICQGASAQRDGTYICAGCGQSATFVLVKAS